MEEKRTHAAKQQVRRQASRAETSFEHDAQSHSAKQNILSTRTTSQCTRKTTVVLRSSSKTSSDPSLLVPSSKKNPLFLEKQFYVILTVRSGSSVD